MNDQLKALQQRIKDEGIAYREHTDVTRTWWERGPQQWKDWVLKREEPPCSAPTAVDERA